MHLSKEVVFIEMEWGSIPDPRASKEVLYPLHLAACMLDISRILAEAAKVPNLSTISLAFEVDTFKHDTPLALPWLSDPATSGHAWYLSTIFDLSVHDAVCDGG